MMGAEAQERILFSEEQIASRVKEVAREIAGAPLRPGIAVPILAGAFVFAADLLRALASEGLDLETEFIWLRSYGASDTPSEIAVLKGPGDLVRGRTVLMIDGVLDRGVTCARARQLLMAAGAVQVICAVAVVKSYPDARYRADYALFRAGEEFLYGYGMDRASLSRGLPDIRVTENKKLSRPA
ncbi:MAG TPA: phosphoribosyltransferase family protein [Micropepsaceae bacterium]|jgi:hypoxanthine phosphoribosyltransferase